MTYHMSQFCPQTWEIAPNGEQTPIDCLKTSFWGGSLHPVFVNLGGNPRGPYVARTIICEPLASLL
ncbi:hypothetical protein KSC_109150 [Ktedonobacter sp. SOSP1-52]|nr:hypothetical protein KSC_109150 [Ktedonobacter sp. SOSP1-52]